jgi:hypothetical protein
MDEAHGFSTGRYRRSILAAALITPAIFAALAWPLILTGMNRGRAAADALNYHEKAIRTFAHQLPHPDFSDYLSATTPGYHVLLAAFARLISDERVALQLFSSLISILLIATIAWACAWRMRRAMSPFGVAAVCLPLVTSLYVLGSGVWLLPDNAGWWALLSVLLLALRRSQNFRTWLAASAVMVILVMTRQIHVWAAGLVWVGAWLGAGPARGESPLFTRQDIGGRILPRIMRAGIAGLLTIPSFLLLYAFVSEWGGLTPPTFKSMHGASVQWAAPAFVLTLLGVFGVFYVAFWREGLAKLWAEQSWVVLVAAASGFALAIAPATTEDPAFGRVTGIWHAVKVFPVVSRHTSVLIVPLATVGAVILVGWLRAMNPRARWVMLAAITGFTLANSLNPQLWQRYYEPFILMWSILGASLAVWSGTRPGRLAVAGPLALAALLAVVAVRGIFYEREALDGGFTPGHVEPAALKG